MNRGRRNIVSALPALTLGPALSWQPGAHAEAQVEQPDTSRAALGAYLGPGCRGVERLEDFIKWLGRRPDRGSDFLSDVSWFELVKAADRSARCWSPTNLPMSFAVPMLPRDKSTTLADGARGACDKHFVQVGEAFVRNGFGTAFVRIGWEFNHSWFTWAAAADPGAWIEFWRRIVAAMRSVPGARFRFDWCVGWSRGQIDPPLLYPGDEYVDVIGMDIYNTSWYPMTPLDRWALKFGAPFGLKWHRDYAVSLGKPMSYPEWGTGDRPDGRGGGDDPHFMSRMTEWIAASPVAYHSYWDYAAKDFDARLSDGRRPLAERVFLDAYQKR